MFNSYYELIIRGIDVKKFVRNLYKRGVSFNSISFIDNTCVIKVDKKNYLKIKSIKTIYEIEVINRYGLLSLFNSLKKNWLQLLLLFIGSLFLFFMSNIIFDVEVIHSDNELKELIINELSKEKIKKYNFIKSYDYIQEVKDKIIDNNRDLIEWIEIERVGTSYIVRVDKRIIKENNKENKVKNIVAKRSGIILNINASNGEIVKKVNDYVQKGDIIISGAIHKGENVLDNVSAEGDVYAEVWYTVKVELPINYKEKYLTGKNQKVLNFSFFNKNYNLFEKEKYNNKNVKEFNLFSDFFRMIKININDEKEEVLIDEVNDVISSDFAYKLARDKLLSNLSGDEYIISQKKLKTITNDSTIIVEVFFKVYENISMDQYYSINEDSD